MSAFPAQGNLPPPEERFHANTVKMTSLIRKVVVDANKVGYDEVTPFIVDLAAKYLSENYDKKSLIESFIIQSHPPINPNDPNGPLNHTIWDRILERDEEFFKEKAFDIFRGLPMPAIEAFKKLATYQDPKTKQSIIEAAERKEIIDYFQAFVKIAIKYVHGLRQPCMIIEKDGSHNNTPKYIYKKPGFMKGVDVLSHAKKWKIQLEFVRE